MHLVIDGYNLIHQSAELKTAHQRGRGAEALLLALALYRAKRPHRVTVVFDGGPRPEPTRSTRQGVAVLHSGGGRSADQIIIAMARDHGPGLTVISDDRDLGEQCRAAGAEVIPARQFAALLMDRAQGREEKDDGDDGDDRALGTRKKGPSHRQPKTRRRRQDRLDRL